MARYLMHICARVKSRNLTTSCCDNENIYRKRQIDESVRVAESAIFSTHQIVCGYLEGFGGSLRDEPLRQTGIRIGGLHC
jgi:hypothetical protein